MRDPTGLRTYLEWLSPEHRTQASAAEIRRIAASCGLPLTEAEARELAAAEQRCLEERARISFAGSVVPVLIEHFEGSPYLADEDAPTTLRVLLEGFFELRDDLTSEITDTEVAETYREAFDEAAGDGALTLSLASEHLGRVAATHAQVLTDDEDNTWQARHPDTDDEMVDDILSPGFFGETWEEASDEW